MARGRGGAGRPGGARAGARGRGGGAGEPRAPGRPRPRRPRPGRPRARGGGAGGAGGGGSGGGSRRGAALGAAAAAAAAAWEACGAGGAVGAPEGPPAGFLTVPGNFQSISEAATAAARAVPGGGGVVRVGTGVYRERLVLEGPVTIEAAPGADVEVRHETSSPYESVADVSAPGVTLRGLRLRHSSKSVAQNYAVLVREGARLALERCDVASATGTGLGVDGGLVLARDCVLSGSKGYGAAVLGDLLGGSPGESVIVGCTVERNGAGGVLARGGARVALERNRVEGNGGFGLELVDCLPGAVRGNRIRGNAGGSVAVAQGVPPGAADPAANDLDAPPRAP